MGLRCFVPDVAPLRFFACAAPVLMSRDFVFWVAPHQPRHCEVPFFGCAVPALMLRCPVFGASRPILGVAPSGAFVPAGGGLRHTGACRAILPPGYRLFVPPHGKSRRLKRRLSHMPGWLPGQCRVRYSISHVAPECSNSSTERILLCALTFSTCRATSRS